LPIKVSRALHLNWLDSSIHQTSPVNLHITVTILRHRRPTETLLLSLQNNTSHLLKHPCVSAALTLII